MMKFFLTVPFTGIIRNYKYSILLLITGLVCLSACVQNDTDRETVHLPDDLKPHFTPPAEFENQLGEYRSPQLFESGESVKTAGDWQLRRTEILEKWHGLMGAWPPVLENPELIYHESEQREDFMQHRLEIEVAPGRMRDAFLLVPDLDGPLPAAVVVFYGPEEGAGLAGELRDFAYQLVKRGFVALSLGSSPGSNYYPDEQSATLQPLSFMAYMAANSYHILANMPEVDPDRIGIVGHSYGGKWAMFASALFDRFAIATWSDGGIVFDETRPNVNYWEPWYLGYDREYRRQPGIPADENPRTGSYKTMIEKNLDLHELHALMAPRPFLVSGGSEDPPERWKALNHTVKINSLLGYEHRVAMHNRPDHSPTEESNDVIYRFFDHFLKQDGNNDDVQRNP